MSETLGSRGNLGGALARATATIPCASGRVLRSERLESSPPAAVERNLRDIARINRWFGGHRTLLRLLKEFVLKGNEACCATGIDRFGSERHPFAYFFLPLTRLLFD